MAETSNPLSMVPSSVKMMLKEPNTALKITTVPLNGTNYLVWSKSASLYLCGRGKAGYVNGKVCRPEESEEAYADWELNDRMVMSWLLNSMEPMIAEGFLFLDSAKEIWEAAAEIYGEKENLARIYQLQQEISKTVKGDRLFHVYLTQLKAMWDELQQYRPISSELEIVKKRLEEDRIFKVLAGLRSEFESVISSVLMMQLMPSFNTVCAMIQREETRKKVMREDGEKKENSGQVAFVATDVNEGTVALRTESRGRGRSSIICSHCKKPGHHRDKCWSLHGHPNNRGRGSRTSAIVRDRKGSDVDPEVSKLITESSLTNLAKLLKQVAKTNLVISSEEKNKGKFAFTVIESNSCSQWVLDSGANRHMTGNVELLHDYSTDVLSHVQVANGNIVEACGQGSAFISNQLELKNVLYVPKCTSNLISVSCLTENESWHVVINSKMALLVDVHHQKMISSAEKRNGLYIFNPVDIVSNLSQHQVQELWHSREGHPANKVLKQMFPFSKQVLIIVKVVLELK
ncbi:unnamed protein product [Victoria cruziana]